jgi:hypothetical protein
MKTTTVFFIGLLAATSVLAQKPKESRRPREIPPNSTGGHLSFDNFQALPSNPADYRISYGKDENQFGVKDQPWLTHVWTFEIDLDPGQLVICDQTGNVYRVIHKNVKEESGQKGFPESDVTVEFVGSAIGVRDVASTS